MNALAQNIWGSGLGNMQSGVLANNALAINADYRNKFDQEWDEAMNQLNKLHFLENDWDGEGAERPTQSLLYSISVWFSDLYESEYRPPSRIVAMIDGSILIEWHHGNGHLEAEVSAPYTAELMCYEFGKFNSA